MAKMNPAGSRNPTEDAGLEHGWAESRNLHPTDLDLRSAGFKILRRPKDAEPVWTLNGREYTQSEAESEAWKAGRKK